MDPILYTEEEYNKYCQGTEKDAEDGYERWTKGETDILLSLCKEYELRWPVIYDRYHEQLEDGVDKLRTMEELQYRYYAIATTVTRARVDSAMQAELEDMAKNDGRAISSTADAVVVPISTASSYTTAPAEEATPTATSSSQQHAPQQNMMRQAMKHRIVTHLGTGASTREFTFQKERMRRYQLELMWNRSRREEEEEMKLREELKLIEAQLRRLKKSGRHLMAANDGTATATSNPTVTVEGSEVVDTSSLIESTTLSFDAPFTSMGKRGVPYLQSSRLGLPIAGGSLNKTLLKKLELTMQELKVPQRPIATKRVCDATDIAKKSILTLLTLQKIAIQREKDVSLKQQRLLKAQNAAAAAKARASAATGAARDTVMATMPPSSSTAATIAVPSAAPMVGGGTSGPTLSTSPLPGPLVTTTIGGRLAGPNAVVARTVPVVGLSVDSAVSKAAIAPQTTINTQPTVERTLPTNMSSSAFYAPKVDALLEENGPPQSTSVVGAGAIQVNPIVTKIAKGGGKAKKKASIGALDPVEVSSKQSASQKEPMAVGGKGKKRKTTPTPKLDSRVPVESFQVPLGTSATTTSTTTAASKAVVVTMMERPITTPAPSSIPQQPSAMARTPGFPPLSQFHPHVPPVIPPLVSRPIPLSAGSEEAKATKKRVKKN